MLCCSALKIHLLCSKTRIFVRLLYAFMYGNLLHVADNFIQTVLLECINKYTNMLYHTMTVLLEYIDRSLQFSIKLMLNIAINICFTLPYYVSIILNAFNNPVCSKLCWHNSRVPTHNNYIFCSNYPVILLLYYS